MRKFGHQTAQEYLEGREASSDEVYIRRFKDPFTRIRFIPYARTIIVDDPSGPKEIEVRDTMAWQTEREHYHPTIKTFPCNKEEDGSGDCVGCDDPNAEVSRRIRKYYFNAMDEKGNVRVFKIGTVLHRTLKGRDRRLGTLSDRDYIIGKEGTGLETTYDVEGADVYPVDFEGIEIFDIDDILAKQYIKASISYTGIDPTEGEVQDTPAPKVKAASQPKPASKEIKAETVQRIVPQTKKTAALVPEPEQSASVANEPASGEEHAWGKNPPEDLIESAELPVIKGWLDYMEVEYPSRAPRQRLVDMAKKKAVEPPF